MLRSFADGGGDIDASRRRSVSRARHPRMPRHQGPCGDLPLLVAPNFDAKVLNLSGENVSVLARRIVVFAMAVLASGDTIAVVENPEPIDRHVPCSASARRHPDKQRLFLVRLRG